MGHFQTYPLYYQFKLLIHWRIAIDQINPSIKLIVLKTKPDKLIQPIQLGTGLQSNLVMVKNRKWA